MIAWQTRQIPPILHPEESRLRVFPNLLSASMYRRPRDNNTAAQGQELRKLCDSWREPGATHIDA